MTFTEKQEKDFQEVQNFISNPENKMKAVLLANQLKEICTKNQIEWFLPSYMYKFTTTDKRDLRNKLNMLKLFNLATSKIENEVELFKIDLDQSAQKKLI
jgi:hypothetical protein